MELSKELKYIDEIVPQEFVVRHVFILDGYYYLELATNGDFNINVGDSMYIGLNSFERISLFGEHTNLVKPKLKCVELHCITHTVIHGDIVQSGVGYDKNVGAYSTVKSSMGELRITLFKFEVDDD